jgi:hypothetical protein
MGFHVVILSEPIQVHHFHNPPSIPVAIGARTYRKAPWNCDDVFYDFVVGENQEIRGLQLQIGKDHPLSMALQSTNHGRLLGSIEFTPCLRIWFSSLRDGDAVGAEAFGDLVILEADDGTMAIGFSSTWLRTKKSAC